MKVLFENERFRIRKAFLSDNIVVQDKGTRRKALASEAAAKRCVILLNGQAEMELSASNRAFLQSYIFERFAMSVLDPEGFAAAMFLKGNPSTFLGAVAASLDPEMASLMGLGPLPANNRLSRELAANGPFHTLFVDHELKLEFSGGRNEVRATLIASGRIIKATPSQCQQFKDFLTAGNVIDGGEMSIHHLRLMHRTFARALVLPPSDPLHQVIFLQSPHVAAQTVLAAVEGSASRKME